MVGCPPTSMLDGGGGGGIGRPRGLGMGWREWAVARGGAVMFLGLCAEPFLPFPPPDCDEEGCAYVREVSGGARRRSVNLTFCLPTLPRFASSMAIKTFSSAPAVIGLLALSTASMHLLM